MLIANSRPLKAKSSESSGRQRNRIGKNQIMELTYNEPPSGKDPVFIEEKLLEFNASEIKDYRYEHFVYKITDASGSIIAGINCQAGGGWLYIEGLWISEDHRGENIGGTLLSAAEKKAKEKGCHHVYLFTYDFQAPGFYLKNGYTVFSKLENFCGEHSKLFMKKSLE